MKLGFAVGVSLRAAVSQDRASATPGAIRKSPRVHPGRTGRRLSAIIEAVGRVAPDILGRRLPLNGAGVCGAALADLGIPLGVLRGVVLLARCAGLVGHIAEVVNFRFQLLLAKVRGIDIGDADVSTGSADGTRANTRGHAASRRSVASLHFSGSPTNTGTMWVSLDMTGSPAALRTALTRAARS